MRYADENGKLLLRDSDDYTPEERKGWGVSAAQIIDKPLPAKWDRETTRWRLLDHCRALVLEEQPREDILRYLQEYNRAGSEVPQWWHSAIPELLEMWEPRITAYEREDRLIKQCSPQDWDCPTAAEIVGKKMAPRLALVTENGQPVIYEKSVNQIFSWRGVGKSLFALGIANLMAGGGSMMRWECGEPRNVLYLDGELPQEQSQERLKEFVSESNREKVRLVSPDLLGIGECINLFNPGHASAVLRMIEGLDIGVLILDSQAMLLPGDPLQADFNDARSRLLHQYRLMGLCVIEVHHGGKSREQRGSSRNDDILDLQIRLAEPRNWEHGDGLKFELQYKKVRHAARLESNYNVTFEDGQWKTVSSDTEVGVMELTREGKTEREIAKALGVDQSTVNRTKKKLAKAGKLA